MVIQLDALPFDLPLLSPFRISHGSRTMQPTLIIRLTDEDGQLGFGEAPMTVYYGLESERCQREIRQLSTAFCALSSRLLTAGHDLSLATSLVHQFLDREAPKLHTFLRCALEVAFQDLWARRAGKRLQHCWDQAAPNHRIPTCYTIGMGEVTEMQAKIKAFPWPIYKIKLGPAHDVDTIRALREVTAATFRVDANTGWTARQTLAYAQQLQSLGVEFIEQPLPVDDLEGQKLLKQESPLPIMADESCQTVEDVDLCAELFHGINVKVVKCGGLLPARQMIQRAKHAGLSVMAGCMTESSVGISAIAQLVPELDYVDIDGALLLAEDPAQGVTFNDRGIVQYPPEFGTGVRLK